MNVNLAWLALFAAGGCEVLWASALPRTAGFTRLWPSLYCGFFIVLSLYLLALATRVLPISLAYAIWGGIGAAGVALYGFLALGEWLGLARGLCLAAIIGGVAGLKLLDATT
ncbi:MAG: multidrug efflux SMR transporter [Burkholderiaceae bacterium]|jgi:quaternary ammonium compound-resistance protein SugE|nr:multidrug efflux SMR transporter [Burkholderiaceae bacterium]